MSLLAAVRDLLLPRRCLGCGRALLAHEDGLCLTCFVKLPRVSGYDASVLRDFGVQFRHGVAFCHYRKGSVFSEVIKAAKYRGQPWRVAALARSFAVELQNAGCTWLGDVDLVVPVPIHWRRRLQRGYNQSEYIAHQVAGVWGLRVDTGCLVRRVYARPQAGKGGHERHDLRDAAFVVRHPERLAGRHVLLVDDVMTTGATMLACRDALTGVPGVSVSFLVMGLTT